VKTNRNLSKSGTVEKELRTGATRVKTKSSGAGVAVMFMKRRAPEPELCHFYDGTTALVEKAVGIYLTGRRSTHPQWSLCDMNSSKTIATWTTANRTTTT